MVELAQGATRRSALWLGLAALALVVAATPADAANKQKQKKASAAEIADIDNGEPMTLVVSIGQQKIDVYRGTTLVTSSAVSTGTAQHPTMIGAFSILEKQRWHHSNIYSNAPMPWMNRITWSGTALHAGVLPGYPASHGCIRLLYSFAPKLFKITSKGDNVITTPGRPKPTLVEHPNLFQPLPPPPLPKLAQENPAPSDESADAAWPASARAAANPIILAKVEGPTTVDSGLSRAEAHEDLSFASQNSAADDPDRIHAITPDASEPRAINALPDAESASKIENRSAVKTADPYSEGTSEGNAPSPAIIPAAAAKVDAGIAAAATQAAEPRSEAPLRMLLTRRTQRDRIIGVQKIFAEKGYLPELNFDGTMGKATIGAIKEFQKANDMPPTGSFTDALVKKVYEVAGKGEPPAGHLFVRQEFDDVFDVPVGFRHADAPLGTHVYTALKFAPGDTNIRWTVIDVDAGSGDGLGALDRIEIPDDVRQKISERLTPGSTFIVADTSINSANLPKGGDFVVLAKSSSKAKVSNTSDDAPKVRRKPRRNADTRRNNYNYNYNYNYNRPPWFMRSW